MLNYSTFSDIQRCIICRRNSHGAMLKITKFVGHPYFALNRSPLTIFLRWKPFFFNVTSILIMHVIVFYFRAEGYVKLNVNINVQVIFSQDTICFSTDFFSTVFNCIFCSVLQLGPYTSQCDFISYFEFYLTTDFHTFLVKKEAPVECSLF